jgi:hypothetical protein
MISLGVMLLILGFVLGIPVLWTIGIILLVAGAGAHYLGATGRAIGRESWYCEPDRRLATAGVMASDPTARPGEQARSTPRPAGVSSAERSCGNNGETTDAGRDHARGVRPQDPDVMEPASSTWDCDDAPAAERTCRDRISR